MTFVHRAFCFSVAEFAKTISVWQRDSVLNLNHNRTPNLNLLRATMRAAGLEMPMERWQQQAVLCFGIKIMIRSTIKNSVVGSNNEPADG